MKKMVFMMLAMVWSQALWAQACSTPPPSPLPAAAAPAPPASSLPVSGPAPAVPASVLDLAESCAGGSRCGQFVLDGYCDGGSYVGYFSGITAQQCLTECENNLSATCCAYDAYTQQCFPSSGAYAFGLTDSRATSCN